MRTAISTPFVLLIMLLGSPALAQPINVTTTDGGSVTTELGYGIKINKNSTLRRSWVVLNDISCPVQLSNAGINTQYDNRDYNYVPTGSAKTFKAISALEIRDLLYDVFGDHMKTLSATDVAAKAVVQLKDMGSWRAWENEVSELLTVVVFVAQVRASDGKLWRHRDKPISEELNKIRLKVTTGVLDPSKDNK